MGPAWFVDWFELIGNVRFNFAELVVARFFSSVMGAGDGVAVALGWGLSVATVIAVSWVWYAGGQKADFNAQLALAVPCILLVSPHTLYYDGGILLIAVVVLLNKLGRLNANLILVVWAAGLLQLLSPRLGVSLSFIPVAVTLVAALVYLWSSGVKSREAQPG